MSENTSTDPAATIGQPAIEARSRNAALFDALSGTYDAVGVDFIGPIAAGLVHRLAPRPGERVADLGCGKGAVLLPAALAVGPTGLVVGTDVSPAMVAAARAGAERAGLTHVDVLLDDAQAPGLPAGSFDVVAASLVLFFLADPAAALHAWVGLLRPGGRLGVSTFGAQDATWRSVDDVFTPYLPQDMLDARTSGARGPFASDAGVEDLLAGAGLGEVRTRVVDRRVRFRDVGQWQRFSMSTGQRAMWASVPEAQRPDVLAEAGRRLAPARQPDGSYTVGQLVRYTTGVRPAT